MKGTMSLGMSLCLCPSVLTVAMKALLTIELSLRFMICKLNFVRNAINLGSIAVNKLTAYLDPCQSSVEYPGDRLLHFHGLVSDEEMFKPTNLDHDNVMVMKNGSAP